MQQPTAESIERYIDQVWPDVIRDIARLVAVDSVEDPATAGPGKPWGQGPKEALDVALDEASQLGFDTHNLDGYIGYAELTGNSPKTLATIAHVDIVPTGTGWATDPLILTQRDGYLLGRGVIDDKGPFVLSLYAAEYFRRLGIRLPYTLHIIAGTNEETGMADVKYYLDAAGEPAFLFTPDAEFPVGHGEKGRFATTFTTGTIAGGTLISLEGGTVANAIPGAAEATVRANAEDLPAASNITVTPGPEPGTAIIKATGIGGHASLPAGTLNALKVLVDYLFANDLYSYNQSAFIAFMQKLCATTDGSALGIDCADDIFDPLTLCVGVAKTEDGCFKLKIDIRYPTATTAEHLHAVLFKEAELHGLTTADPSVEVPFYVPADSPEINALISAYNAKTGQDAKPFTMGGGTYARHFANAASFGPETGETMPSWVGMMHGPNEGVSEATLKEALAIYIDAIARLMSLPNLGN